MVCAVIAQNTPPTTVATAAEIECCQPEKFSRRDRTPDNESGAPSGAPPLAIS